MKNWAGNQTYSASHVVSPRSVEELQECVRTSERVKGLGTRHSFNRIADTAGTLISFELLNRVLSLDPAQGTVTVEAGVRYGELCRFLSSQGFALPNLASLPHISVAGACATATHGSGDRNGCLSTSVRSMELVTSGGDLMTFEGQILEVVAVHLGALGIVTKLALSVVPTFNLCQSVYFNLPSSELKRGFDEITSAAYSVSLFTDWRTSDINQVWVKSLQPMPTGSFFGAIPADAQTHPIPGMPAENCTGQLGVAGSWDERLPHFRMEFTPSSGDELQSEYIVPRRHALEAFEAVGQLREAIAPLLHISEIRNVAADELWLSPFYGRESVAIHFTWRSEWGRVRILLPQIEAALRPFEARPHWGKLFCQPGEYPKKREFVQLANRLDPNHKFRNEFLDANLF